MGCIREAQMKSPKPSLAYLEARYGKQEHPGSPFPEPPRKVPSLIMQLTNIVGGILLFIVLVVAIFLAIAAINILWSLQ